MFNIDKEYFCAEVKYFEDGSKVILGAILMVKFLKQVADYC